MRASELGAEAVYRCRLATRALDLVVRRYGVEHTALKFNPDDPAQVVVGTLPGEVRFFRDATPEGNRSIAKVYVIGPTARVTIEDLRQLIRPNHRRDFRAVELGIMRAIDIEVDVAGVIESEGEVMRSAPLRRVERPRGVDAPGYVSALSAVRR